MLEKYSTTEPLKVVFVVTWLMPVCSVGFCGAESRAWLLAAHRAGVKVVTRAGSRVGGGEAWPIMWWTLFLVDC